METVARGQTINPCPAKVNNLKITDICLIQLAQAKIIKKWVILFWLLDMTI